MQFEIIFITEGAGSTPAAEIQYDGQRLCILRVLSTVNPEIEFVQDLYIERSGERVFPLNELLHTIQLAVDGLTSWRQNLADGRAEA